MNAHAGQRAQHVKLDPEMLVVTIHSLRQMPGIPDHHQQVCQRRKKPDYEYEKRITE
jgi:hypothetical protein